MCFTHPPLRGEFLDVPGSVSIGIRPVEHDDEIGRTEKHEDSQQYFHCFHQVSPSLRVKVAEEPGGISLSTSLIG